MKLKKLAAVAMAAVMSLAMLTACSGGGGSSSSPVTDGNAYTVESETLKSGDTKETATVNGSKSFTTSDGTWVYSTSTSSHGYTYELLRKRSGDESYQVNTKTDPWIKMELKSSSGSSEAEEPIKKDKKEEPGVSFMGGTYRKITWTYTYKDRIETSTSYLDSTGSLKYAEYEETGADPYYSLTKYLRNERKVDAATVQAGKLDKEKYTTVTKEEFQTATKEELNKKQ